MLDRFQSPSLMRPCPACFGSGGFQPVGPLKWSLPRFAPPGHRADRLPCQQATVDPACCRRDYCRDQVLTPGAQTWMMTDNRIRMCYHIRMGLKLCVYVCVYLSELSAGLGVCRGRSAMQKSSTVNFPSFLSAPYIAITLPKKRREKTWRIRVMITAATSWSSSGVIFRSCKVLDLKKNPDLWHTCLCLFFPPVWSFAAHPPESAHLSRWCIWLVQAGAAGCAKWRQENIKYNAKTRHQLILMLSDKIRLQTSSLISFRIDGCKSIRLNNVPTMQHCSPVWRSHSFLMSTSDPGGDRKRKIDYKIHGNITLSISSDICG